MKNRNIGEQEQSQLNEAEEKELINWYDQFTDQHEKRGEHRVVITREVEPQTHHERDRFGSYFQYLVSVLGFAAGFGSVWRFPYLIFKNGGGVFLIPYFVLLVLIGIPSFYFETAIGQMFQRGPPQIFQTFHKKWKGFGVFSVLVNLTMSTYYNLILAYSIYFLWKSFSYPLPWALSDIEEHPQPWNKVISQIFVFLAINMGFAFVIQDYFYKDFLNSSSGLDELGGIVLPILACYLLSQLLVYLCISKGVSVSGKIALFTATSPYVLLFLLMIRGLFLQGAWSGIEYLFNPDWSKIFNLQVWVDAANQIIFQISTGCSVLIFFGSYRHPHQEIKQTSMLIPLLTVTCGFLASIVIFSFMGYISTLSGIPISEIPLSGPDLAFVVFPAVLTFMPFSNILSIMFFLTMVFLGIDTQFAFMDGLAGAIEDEFHGGQVTFFNKAISMPTVRFVICAFVSLSGFLYCSQAGFFYLGFIDDYGVSINLIFAVFIEVYFFTWMNDWDTIEVKIKQYIKVPTPDIIIKLLKYSVPLFTGVLGITAFFLQLMRIGDQPWQCSLVGWACTLYPYGAIIYFYNKYKNEPNQKENDGSSLSQKLAIPLIQSNQE